MNQSRDWIHGCACGIHHGNAAIGGEPDAPLRIRDHRLVSLYALSALEAIFRSVLANVPLAERVSHQTAALYPQYMTRRCDPKPAVFVFRYSEYRFVQRVWQSS